MSPPVSKVAPWEDFILRVIAIYKLIHALFFIAVGFGLLRLRHHNIVQFLNDYFIVPYHINPESHIVDWFLDQAQNITSHRLAFFGYAAFFYAALFLAEGIGLYLRKRWAEYMVVIVTGSFLPFEIYEIFVRVVWWKFLIVAGNLLIVGYLVHRLMLDARNEKVGEQPAKKNSPAAPPSSVSKVIPTEVP
ncbi:MAG: DUF2127 domain-containing protein [Methylacidiphilales bacterium]|nr:DUF2127 domain-containing protein [Candidatus Methylacidiphilales bacterium]